MNRKPVAIAGFTAIFVVSMIAVSSTFTDVSGEPSEKPNVPRYSETCAHGHNGFDCKTPKHIVDISELQEKTTELEKRVAQLERTR
jgi:hypothetical protein